MGQRFRRVIAQPRGDRNPRVTVDHKGIVRVVDDCGKFHLQNSVELIDGGIDVKSESPCHRVSPSLAILRISGRYDSIGFRRTRNKRAGSTIAAFTETESG